ncbi:hypothetical protein [Paracoccus versutus]
MATSGEMVAAIADLFDVNAVTVESIDRSLSAAGLRRKGGRGRSALHMTGSDIVSLTFALILGTGMKDAPEKVGKVSRMPRLHASVQWRPEPETPLSALAEQVEQYQEYPAATAGLGVFPGGAALAAAGTLGEGVAALVDAMAAGEFRSLDDVALNLQMSSVGPSARLAYATRAGVLRVHYETTGPEAERPVFERRFKLDESLLRRLAGIIATR